MLHVVYWGHDYGHVYDIEFPSRKAAEENDLEDYKMLGFYGSTFPAALRIHPWNPMSSLHLQEWIEDARIPKSDATISDTPEIDVQHGATDRLSILPTELQGQILCELPSTDVFNALMASRSFHSIGLPQTFWSSRFKTGFEFGHLFEVLRTPKRADTFCDYRKLYAACQKYRNSTELLCHKRVLTLVEPLAMLMALYNGCSIQGHLRPSLPSGTGQCNQIDDDSSWQWACRSQDAVGKKSAGGQNVECRKIAFKECPQRLDVSIVDFHELSFVTSICITYADGSTGQLGYLLSTTKCISDVALCPTQELKGFAVGFGLLGINGLGSVASDGSLIKLAGLSEPDCKIRKIVIEDTSFIGAYIDVNTLRHPLQDLLTTSGVQAC